MMPPCAQLLCLVNRAVNTGKQCHHTTDASDLLRGTIIAIKPDNLVTC
jgi:hypothetical protein